MSEQPIRPIALITGASRGLGRSMALALAQRGWDLVITYRERADQADTLRREVEALGGRLVALALDVGQAGQFPDFAAQVEAALQAQWGGRRLQALVNNAGVGIYAPLVELTEAQFDALVAIHLKGPIFLTQALLPLLADGGRIVNISSGLTRFSLPGYGAYAAMKGAIEVFTRYLAKELGARGIAVNTVAPGAIETDFGGAAVRDKPEVNSFIASQTALGRAGVPEDIGPMVASLLSPDQRWVNAQRIEVSGGMFL
ncbi:SDR family NAD(P)-dependent oxidoreductase [Ideonella dechloratans]|uniref:SDR family NAD(P)-dependent oxidoreductase n=1 Tax=Ideonella dechloratans TaxID=36863 RepID=UPI0035B1ECDC